MTAVAALTVVHQSPVILRKWIEHHGALLGEHNLYVVAHGDCPEHRDIPGDFNYMVMPRKFDASIDSVRMGFVQDFIAALLRHFDAAIYTDVDELLLHRPGSGLTLSDYLLSDISVTRAPLFFNIVPHPSFPAIDWSRPVLSQVRGIRFAPKLCNPCVFYDRPSLRGRHASWDTPHRIDPGLVAFHLKYVDIGLMGAHYEKLKYEIGCAVAAKNSGGAALKGWSQGRSRLENWAKTMALRPLEPPCPLDSVTEYVKITEKVVGGRSLFLMAGQAPDNPLPVPADLMHCL